MTVVAIDGPAGAGKSTVARGLARALGFGYLDSGAMYRCVALAAMRRGAPAAEIAAGLEMAPGERVLLDGEDVSNEIRTPEVSQAASQVAADPRVREVMVARQRHLLAHGDWVAEGRDIGTVVAPNAELKVFLSADPQERARRRATELGAELSAVAVEQALRDQRDRDRPVSPLLPAPDAVRLDTTAMPVEDVIGRIAELVRELS